MNLDDILYVEVNLERPLVSDAFAASTDFAVVLEHCWGTPHNNRNGDLKEKILIFADFCVCSCFQKLQIKCNPTKVLYYQKPMSS